MTMPAEYAHKPPDTNAHSRAFLNEPAAARDALIQLVD